MFQAANITTPAAIALSDTLKLGARAVVRIAPAAKAIPKKFNPFPFAGGKTRIKNGGCAKITRNPFFIEYQK